MKQSIKRTTIIVIALLLIFGFRYLPVPNGLNTSAMQVLGIFLGVLLLWLTISIDWPSVLALGALILVPELSANSVFASSFGNTTFAFLLFTFLCTYTLSETTIIKRTAMMFITSSIARKGAWHFIILFFTSIIVIGCFISPTVLFVIYLPILEEIYHVFKLEKGNKVASMLMMGTVFCCGISSGMTPIAHVFPLISMGLFNDATGISISYANYMGFGIPIGIIATIMMILVFRFVLRPSVEVLKLKEITSIKKDPTPIRKDEKIIIAIFGLVIAMWVLPSIIKLLFKGTPLAEFAIYLDSLSTAMPPLIGVVLLSIITLNGKPLLNFKEAMAKGVSWPSLIMCASTLALGSAMTNSNIGLTAYLSESIQPLIANMGPMLLVFILILWSALQTNVSSNMVTATVVTTIALAITLNLTTVNTGAIACLIGMMSAYAFATPPAMPSVAIAGSSGWTTTIELMKYGFTLMIISVIIATFIGYPLANILI